MFRVLAIGNSFTEDATYYLHQILESGGMENEVINLYIGGCSLERHWRNMERDSREYQYQRNGIKTDRYVSVQEVLDEQKFDVIVTQQASGDSGWENTYEPFLGLMIQYLVGSSGAKIYLNQTWAYEEGSSHENFMRYNRDQQQMYQALTKAYENAAERYGLPLIKSGEIVQKVRELSYFKNTGRCITRDGYHMSYLYGRYAVALVWAKTIAGIEVKANGFVPEVDFMPCEKADIQIVEQIKQIAEEMKNHVKS